MMLNYASLVEVVIIMTDYVKLVLQDVPEDMQGEVAATPTGNHLFLITEKDLVLLDGKRQDSFVHIVMQLINLSQRARPVIRMAVSFLCGCLSVLDVNDYKKAHRVIKYLQGMQDMLLKLSGDGKGVMQWWIDCSRCILT